MTGLTLTLGDARGSTRATSNAPVTVAFAALLLVLAASWLLARLWRQQRARESCAYERALAQLAAAVPDSSARRADLFAERVSRTVREYIEARFELPASTGTTEEFLRNLLRRPELGPNRAQLRTFVHACEYARFAGRALQRDALYGLRAAAVHFVAAAERSPHKQR